MNTPELCPCGKPLHYLSKASERKVRALIDDLGEMIPVSVCERLWLVSRHYIALHGLRAIDLPDIPHAVEICQTCRRAIRECVCGSKGVVVPGT